MRRTWIQRGRSRFDRPLWACTGCRPGGDLPECPEIGRLFWHDPNAAGPHHHRDLWEIGYFPDGHRGYRHHDAVIAVPPGCALISPPGCIHGEGPVPGLTQDMRWFQLRWPTGKALPGMTAADSRELRRRLTAASELGPLPMTDTFPRDFYHLLCILQAQRPYVRIKARSLLHALLCMLVDGADRVAADAVPSATPHDPDLDPAIGLMRQRLSDPPPLRELAAACDLSERRFRTRFQQAHGMPPSDYQQRLRIQAAMVLMEDAGVSIAAAADATGFGSAQYFATVFKKVTQATPSHWRWNYYRRRHRDDPVDPEDVAEIGAS